MECLWKQNWQETKKHFTDWWNRKGLILGMWDAFDAAKPHEIVSDPGKTESIEESYVNHEFKSKKNHYSISKKCFDGDILPIANVDLGPGSLALFLGSEPGFSERTIWFNPIMKDDENPENRPALKFNPENKWWKITEALLRESVKLSNHKYIVGCHDLIENIDILASLRGTETLLMDMVERPDWVKRKLDEINQVWFEAYSRIYDIIKLEDDSSAFRAFYIWGPGKTAKVQCDASAMFSPAMFEQFVVPALSRQCEWLDYSMFHLDGHQCLAHLDSLLSIKGLDAIEWTPDPTIPSGGNKEWYSLYRKILDAGKSVQAVGIRHKEIIPLLDAVGGKGMYIHTSFDNEKELETLIKKVEPYR
ncbi:MAG: hypothetical protein PHE88_06010 [Elusimicrobia bacterium]|nr:hypothetical protein [Elusimicrobiota bacterium]